MARETPTPLILNIDRAQCGRLDNYLVQTLDGQTRSAIQNLIRAGLVLVNGEKRKTGYALELGDRIEIDMPESARLEPEGELQAVAMELDILFEDESLLVINKPAGLVVHPGAGTRGKPTLLAGVLAHLQREAKDLPGEADRPGVVHRLDKDTSGVIVLAKSLEAHRHLASQFKNKTNLREYVALLDGAMHDDEKIVESYLHRDPRYRTRFASLTLEEYAEKQSESSERGRQLQGFRFAKTIFNRRKVYGRRLTLAIMRLETGRTHQIRVHARSLGLPIWGDIIYGSSRRLPPHFPDEVREKIENVPRLLLHARRLGFVHPTSGQKLAFEAPLPADFRGVLELLEKHSQSS